MKNNFYTKQYNKLELDKILNTLADRCVSLEAKENALNILPSLTLQETEKSIKLTEDAYILIAKFGSPSFSSVKNMSNALRRAESGGMLSMGELLSIAGVLKSIRLILEWRSHSEGLTSSLDDMFSALTSNKFLEEMIVNAILSEEEMSDNASPALYDIRRKIVAAGSKIRDKLDSMVKSSTYQKYLQDAVVTQRDGRFCVPVKAECRANVQGLVHDTSSTGSTLFIEPMAVVEANNEIKMLKGLEAEEIERILFELSSNCAEFADSIITSTKIMVELDLIFAKAKLGFDMKASVPILNDKGIIELKRARHPLLDKNTVVPVDVSLGEDFDSLIITGPNTGGKTVTIKTIGLICLMAMCGLLIPCADNSKVSVFGSIFADIGDEQSIEQSLSTFSSHIKNIIEILNRCDDKSLVLLDELCSGTDPVEGAALATAIIEKIRSKGTKLAATTHYAELKAYALDTNGVINACCEFDVETLSPTYKLLIGVPGRSNAFAISTKLGIDKSIVDNAKNMVSSEDNRFERVVAGLEKSKIELDRAKEQSEIARKKAEAMEKEQAEMLLKLKTDYDREIENAKAAARIITDNARIEVNRILDEMEKLQKEKKADLSQMRAQAKKNFAKLDSLGTTNQQYEEDYTLPRELKEGDLVRIPNVSAPATVLSVNGKSVMVQAGIMKCKIDIKDVRLVEDKGINIPKNLTKKRNTHKSKIEDAANRQASMEIDLRGADVLEATLELDRFIDQAVLNNQNVITIIHGKGTGALRKGVHSYLKKHKAIRTFRLGTFGEGESGVTIAELK